MQSFKGNFEKIPLFSTSLALQALEPESAVLIVDDGKVCLIASGEGVTSLKLQFAPQELPDQTNLPLLELKPSPSPIMDFQVVGLAEDKVLKLGDASLKSLDGVIQIPHLTRDHSWVLFVEDIAKQKTPRALIPSDWNLQNEVLVFENEGVLQYLAKTRLSAIQGSGVEGKLLLPAHVRALKIEGEDLIQQDLSTTDQGLTEVKLTWKTREVLERELKISYAIAQLPAAETWSLVAPRLLEEKKMKSVFLLPHQSGIELKASGLQNEVPATQLSSWIKSEKTQGSSHYAVIPSVSKTEIQRRILPRLETARAIINRAVFTSRVVSDGSMMSEGEIEVDHETLLRWKLALPKDAVLLKCLVNDVATQPLKGEQNEIEIELPKISKNQLTRVQLSYMETKASLNAVEGDLEAELLQTPIFIHEVQWKFQLPESYEVIAEGNVEVQSSSSSHEVLGVKRLCLNERPQIQVFYRKRGLE